MKKIISVFILAMFALTFLTCKKVDKDPNDKYSVTQLNSKPSAAPTTTTTLAFWTTSSTMSYCGGSISVYLDGISIGTLYYSTSSPSCTSSLNLKKSVSVGQHEYYAVSSNGFYTCGNSPSDGLMITVTSNSCNLLQLVPN